MTTDSSFLLHNAPAASSGIVILRISAVVVVAVPVATHRSLSNNIAFVSVSRVPSCWLLNIYSFIVTWSRSDSLLDDHSLISVSAGTEAHFENGLEQSRRLTSKSRLSERQDYENNKREEVALTRSTKRPFSCIYCFLHPCLYGLLILLHIHQALGSTSSPRVAKFPPQKRKS